MKKYRQLIIGIIIGGIVFGGSAIAYSYSAKQVSFTPSDKEWKVTNVDDAINDLRMNINSKPKELTFSQLNSSGTSQLEINTNFISVYKKLMITGVRLFYGGSCTQKIASNDGNQTITLNKNVEYNLENLYNQGYKKIQIESGNWCSVTFKLYN